MMVIWIPGMGILVDQTVYTNPKGILGIYPDNPTPRCLGTFPKIPLTHTLNTKTNPMGDRMLLR
mgnify:CR=1 FL=1